MKKKWLSFALILMTALCSLSTLPACKKNKNPHSRYEINVEYVPEREMVTGTVKVHFENTLDAEIDVLKFQLYANAYRENATSPIESIYINQAYYNGESYGEMTITSVNGAKNWEVGGKDESILYAYLEQPLFTGDSVVLDVAFTLKLAQVLHTTGVTQKAVNLGYFFPILCGEKNGGFVETAYTPVGEPFYLDTSDFTLSIQTPKEYSVCGSGEEISVRTLERQKVHTMSVTNARSFALVLSDSYQIQQTNYDGIELNYYHFADENAEKVMQLMQEAIAFYQSQFGEYPYPAFSVAQTGHSGTAPSLTGVAMVDENLRLEAQREEILRALASQWWTSAVGCDMIENAWQGVGLSAYSAITFYEQFEKYAVQRETQVAKALKEYRSYYDLYGSVLGRTDTKMTHPLTAFINGYEYQCLEIDKAIVMFDTLRKGIGDETFFRALKKYYKSCAFQRAMPADMVGAFERTGVDAHGFFESFLQGKAIL